MTSLEKSNIGCPLCHHDIDSINDCFKCPCGRIFCPNCHGEFDKSELPKDWFLE